MLKESRIRENLSLVFLLCMAVVFFSAIYAVFGRDIMIDLLLLVVYVVSFSLLGVVLIYGIYTNPPASQLMEEMELLKTDIKTLEQKFLKREITEQNFLKMLGKKHRRLIKVEAKVYKKTSPLKLSGLKAGILKRRDRSALKRLLAQKAEILAERRIAACKLYRRRIDRGTFQKFIEENDASLVQTESLIKILFTRIAKPKGESKRERIIREIVKEEKVDADRMAKELAEQEK